MSCRTVLTALTTATVLTAPLTAQGWIERPTPIPEPRGPVARISSSVRITLDGRVARYEVEELFRNEGKGIAEGSYLYPLPGEAVFTDFSLFMGDQEMKGEMMNAEKARGIYEEIVRKLRDPALLSLAGHGLVRAQVFPIQPGETRKVILRYTQVLAREGDAYRIRHPLGTRGGGPITLVATATQTERFGTPYSPTHRVATEGDARRLRVRVEAEPRGELELFFPIRNGLVGTSVFTHAPGGGERFFMLVLSPPAVGAEEIMPRDLTMVVDVSGSMAGAKLEQARGALYQALGSLRPRDRFRLITFSTTVTDFRDGWTPATREAIAAARGHVDRLEARGGTNIAGALHTALEGDAPRGGGRLGILLFLTDGLPSVGEQSPERIAANVAAQRGAMRVFPIGVGHDVNTYLLDRLAVEGRGTVEYVAPEASVETAVGNVLRRVDAPALVNLRIVRAPVELVEVSPAELPDLYFGDDLVVFGRYQGSGTGEVVIEGERMGRRERFTTRADFAAHSLDHDYIPPLWAARRIGELTRQGRLEVMTPELVARIRELALRYGILTEFTSYLVQEPGQVAVGPQPIPMAAPTEQTGRAGFLRAERSATLAQAKSLAEADQANDRLMRDDVGERERPESKRSGGRVFVRRGAVWTDIAHTDSVRIVTVTAFSPAYFALVRALPELAPCLTVGDEVLVAGRRVSLRIGLAGTTQWEAGELARVVGAFRGA